MKINASIRSLEDNSLSKFSQIDLSILINYLKRLEAKIQNNADVGTAVKGKHKNSKRPPKKNDKL